MLRLGPLPEQAGLRVGRPKAGGALSCFVILWRRGAGAGSALTGRAILGEIPECRLACASDAPAAAAFSHDQRDDGEVALGVQPWRQTK